MRAPALLLLLLLLLPPSALQAAALAGEAWGVQKPAQEDHPLSAPTMRNLRESARVSLAACRRCLSSVRPAIFPEPARERLLLVLVLVLLALLLLLPVAGKAKALAVMGG